MTDTEPRAEWPDAVILVVDDEPLICRMLERILDVRGYTRVHAFTDPLEALERYDDLGPDLLLLDLHLPRLDGAGVLDRIQAKPREQRAPVIIMTGAGRAEDAHRTLARGAADFLHKPVDTTELLLRVRHQLRERRLRRQLAEQNERLEALVEARAGELRLLSRVLDEMPLPAFVLTPELATHYTNARGAALTEHGGGTLLAVLPPARSTVNGRVRERLGSVGSEPELIPAVLETMAGAERRVELQAQLLDPGYVAVLVHDIEEQELAKEALGRALDRERQSVERLRALEALRTNFLTAVSHELRTPLTVVLGVAELLRRRGPDLAEGQQRDLLERLEGNADRLGRLLEDLLDLNRLSERQRDVRLERTDLAEVVTSAVAEVVDVEGRDIEVEVVSCLLDLEVATMRRVVTNLARNAIVHTPEGTRIDVRLTTDGDRARLAVTDEGPGVPDRLKKRIFDRFEQGGSAPSHRPGTGIGLSLVQGFVELHGGQVWVEDTPGGGATFLVELPVPDPEATGGPEEVARSR